MTEPTAAYEKKLFRTFFHVKPLPVYVKQRPKKGKAQKPKMVRLDWICEGDRKTKKYLHDVHESSLGDRATFEDKKDAMENAFTLCQAFKPSERVEHRMPDRKKGERGFPIVDRSTYGDDPHPPSGAQKKDAPKKKAAPAPKKRRK